MKKNLFTRGLSLLLMLVLVFTLAACSGKTEETTTAAPETTTEAPETTTDNTTTEEDTTDGEETTDGEVTTDATVTYLNLSVSENFNQYYYVSAYDNYDGTAYMEYSTTEKKVAAAMDLSVLEELTKVFMATELPALNGQDSYEDGEASGSMFVELSDGSMYTYSFSGATVSAAYSEAFNTVCDAFITLMADVPEYVPAPMYMGEIDPALRAAIDEILEGSTLVGLDGYTISDVAVDEYFGAMVGLTNAEGISSGLLCAPMMMTNAYSLAIVTLDGAEAADVAADFEQTMDWRKWVCVAPTNAMIAQKDNMILCLMAGENDYAGTVDGIEAAGWEVLKTLTNPDL